MNNIEQGRAPHYWRVKDSDEMTRSNDRALLSPGMILLACHRAMHPTWDLDANRHWLRYIQHCGQLDRCMYPGAT